MSATLPKIVPRHAHPVSRRQIAPDALTVLYQLKHHGHAAYLAGGSVRDLLIGRQPKDFDVATDAPPERVRKLFRRCRLVGRRFRLAHVMFGNDYIEVATFRTTVPVETPAPETVVATDVGGGRVTLPPRFLAHEGMIVRDNQYGTPAEDAVRRDFTINALFYDIRDFTIVDYVNGLEDLRHGLIRSIGDPEIRFVEDPVRMLRAVRFAATLGFVIEPACVVAMQRHHARLALANRHRLYDEWLKVIGSGALDGMADLLIETGLLLVLLPGFANWLAAVDDGRRKRFHAACRWLDEHRFRLAAPVPVDLTFAIMLGEYLEDLTRRKTTEGMPWFPAALEAVGEAMAADALPMMVPRSVVQNVARLIAVQARFQPGRGNRSRRFREQAIFAPAFEVFQFLCQAQQRPPEWAAAWNDEAPVSAGRAAAAPVKPPRRRRPRRRKKPAEGAVGGP